MPHISSQSPYEGVLGITGARASATSCLCTIQPRAARDCPSGEAVSGGGSGMTSANFPRGTRARAGVIWSAAAGLAPF